MERKVEPWHELVFICPGCCKEFQHKSKGLDVRHCPECEEKKSKKMIALKGLRVAHKAAIQAELSRNMTTG
jgi:hypothetical protein